MSYDAMSTCAALTLTLAIEDMAAESCSLRRSAVVIPF